MKERFVYPCAKLLNRFFVLFVSFVFSKKLLAPVPGAGLRGNSRLRCPRDGGYERVGGGYEQVGGGYGQVRATFTLM